MVDFATALTAVGQGLKVLKDLNQVNQEFDKADLKLKLAELSGALAQAQLTIADAQREAAEMDAEIARLLDTFLEKADLVEHHGCHYRKRSTGKPQGRPYCPRCLQKGKLYMTHSVPKQGRPLGCPECKSEYAGITEFLFENE